MHKLLTFRTSSERGFATEIAKFGGERTIRPQGRTARLRRLAQEGPPSAPKGKARRGRPAKAAEAGAPAAQAMQLDLVDALAAQKVSGGSQEAT